MIKTPFTRSESRQIVVRRSTVVGKKRAEIEPQLTKSGVERFLKEVARGAFDAEVRHAAQNAPIETSEAHPSSVNSALDESASPLKVGDQVTVRLTQLEFSGLTGLAQMLAAAKAPTKFKSLIENASIFSKVGAGLDFAYGALRSGLEFSTTVAEWTSTPSELVYVDIGQKLPVPFKSWQHKHTVSDTADGGMITDEITVDVEPGLAAPIAEGALRFHLESRAKIYARLFSAETVPS